MLNHRHLTRLAPIALALALSGAAFAASDMESQDAPLRCEIEVTQTGGMISLVGLVEADHAIAGSYSFAVESSGGSGSSNIRQGGGFSVAPGETVTLGRVMLGANGVYDASLELATDSGAIECEERAGRL